jgi:hypothetical protein
MRKVIQLKCISPFFQDVWDGKKKFEIREDNRNFEVGDHVFLNEYNSMSKTYLDRRLVIEITYLIRKTVCLKEGYCAFGIKILRKIGVEVI